MLEQIQPLIDQISTLVLYLYLFLLTTVPAASFIALLIMSVRIFRGDVPTNHDCDKTDNPETGCTLFSPIGD